MPVTDAPHNIVWEPGDVPVDPAYGDSFYARSDGLAEARHVFLEGNALADRFAAGAPVHVAELGFGTGLNFCAAWAAWQAAGARAPFAFTTFEAAPMAPADRARALARWPELAGVAGALAEGLETRPETGAHEIAGARFRLIAGDARETVPGWQGVADAWFLDGFAPARNPEMWEAPLMAAVFARTAPGGTVATYSAAGHVRRALDAAGFAVARRPGFGRKREMLAGRRPI